MRLATSIFVWAFSFALPAMADRLENSCAIKDCPVGTKAKTYATKNEPFFGCPTAELVDYTNTIIGLMSMQMTLGATPPNISPTTGEPSWEGKLKL